MIVDTPTVVVIVLLVLAASLASYLVSQWSAISGGRGIVASVAITAGATALLIAAAIVVLSLRLPSLLHHDEDTGTTARATESLQPGGASAAHRATGADATPEQTTSVDNGSAEDHRSVSGAMPAVERTSEPVRSVAAAATLTSITSRADVSSTAPAAGGLAIIDPWAATRCVRAFRRDPENLTRWTLENECSTPVGIVFAACDDPAATCDMPQSTSWRYDVAGILLPQQAQRSVTVAEETREGTEIRYVACNVLSRQAAALIGQDSEAQSSPDWIALFAAARETDECLVRVRHWSDAGKRSSLSIDALIGSGLPGRTRRASRGIE